MSITASIARAFCRDHLGGNQAGVVLVKQPLTNSQMQTIATHLNFSETIFLFQKDLLSYKALYFTPTSSIDFCGYASLAAFGVLREQLAVEIGSYVLETPVGRCEVTLTPSLIFLSQPLPTFGEIVPATAIAPALGIPTEDISDTKMPPQVVATGLRDIFVPIISQECLFNLRPDLSLIKTLSENHHAIGMHIFSLDAPETGATAHCRNFAPLVGIPEESATGSSSGALACYLFNQGMLPKKAEQTLLFKQGDVLNEPCDIYARLCANGDRISRVECGGHVIVTGTKEIPLQ